jgi:3-dehydroquinate synthase
MIELKTRNAAVDRAAREDDPQDPMRSQATHEHKDATAPTGSSPADDVLEQCFEVTFRYPIFFTRDLFATTNGVLRDVLKSERKEKPKLLAVADRGFLQHHTELECKLLTYADEHKLDLVGPVLQLSGGENIKQTAEGVSQVLEAIHQGGIDRHSYVLAIGGGAILDAVGYAAAIAHRGVRLIRIPTTVLSQNDSGVGVKNAINAFGKKNFLGTFTPPYAVLNDLNFLGTLPDREWRSGIAEAIKVALIKDKAFFLELHGSATRLVAREQHAMQRLVIRCAQLHLNHIASGDPFEKGSARPLDFGHWAAHRLEFLTDYRLRHGEAVAVGIALDTIYSRLAGYLSAESCERVLELLRAFGFDLWVDELGAHLDDQAHPRSVLRGLEEFREHLGGDLTVTLLREIGSGFEVHEMDLSLVRLSIEELRALAALHGPRPVPATSPGQILAAS